VKCATITPNEARVRTFGAERMYRGLDRCPDADVEP
jgi:hypothetical protein